MKKKFKIVVWLAGHSPLVPNGAKQLRVVRRRFEKFSLLLWVNASSQWQKILVIVDWNTYSCQGKGIEVASTALCTCQPPRDQDPLPSQRKGNEMLCTVNTIPWFEPPSRGSAMGLNSFPRQQDFEPNLICYIVEVTTYPCQLKGSELTPTSIYIAQCNEFY